MPPVALFFGVGLFVVISLLAFFAPDLNPCDSRARTLDMASRGRLVAMLTAVTIFWSLPNDAASLWITFSLVMLCAAQSGIALVLVVASIPSPAVYGSMKRLAAILPGGSSRWLRYHTIMAERDYNRRMMQ